MRSRLTSIAFALLVAASSAHAAEVVYGPDGAPTVVQRKLHTMSSRWEAGLTLGTALNASLVDHYGGLLSVTYHPNEWADFGVELGANYTRVSALGQEVRSQLPPRANPRTGTANYTRPVGELGAGMRFYLSRTISLLTELRAFFHPATVVRGADLTQPGTGSTERYLGVLTVLGVGASALF